MDNHHIINKADNTQVQNIPSYVMYILVNNDLKMGKGKIASQVGHVVGLIVEDIMRNALESKTDDVLDSTRGIGKSSANEDYQMFLEWKKNYGHKKIVLKAKEEDLTNFIKTEQKCCYILDAGKTQIAPKSLTVVGFYPRNDQAEKFKNFSLL